MFGLVCLPDRSHKPIEFSADNDEPIVSYSTRPIGLTTADGEHNYSLFPFGSDIVLLPFTECATH